MRTWDRAVRARSPTPATAWLRLRLRGYGRSSRPTGAPYSHVRDLLAVLDAAGAERGARRLLDGRRARDRLRPSRHPDRVWALVPVAAALGGVEDLEEEIEWWERVSAPIEAALEAGDLERAEDLRLELLWAPLGTDDPAGARIREIAFDNLHEITMDESGAEELDPPAAHRSGEIDVPTLVIAAEHDPPGGRRLSELIARGVLDARLVTIEGADHVVNLRQPDAFEAAVLPFLGEVR